MITLTIDNPELERIFYEEFDGDNTRFVEFLSQSCHVNNIDYIDNVKMEALIEEGESSGDSGYSVSEAFAMLRKEFDASYIK